MNRIFALRSGNNVTLNFNGATKQFVCADEDSSKQLFATISNLRAEVLDNNPESLLEIEHMMDPHYRLKDIEGLTRDNDGNFYFGNYSEPVPSELVYKIKEYHDLGISTEPLINFWKLLMLNPDKHVRHSLFKFAERFSFPITDRGYFIAYKSVAWKGESDKGLALAVASEYIYKKASGKSTDNICVVENLDDGDILFIDTTEEYKSFNEFVKANEVEGTERVTTLELIKMSEEEIAALDYVESDDTYWRTTTITPNFKNVGILTELYTSIVANMDYDTPTFTDWHTKRSTIVLGTAVSMPRKDCDNNPSNTCSSGLHVGAPGYVKSFGGSSDSNYILACLVSPMNVVAVPEDYDFEKMRTCEYLPYAVCKLNDDGTIREVDTRYFEEDYSSIEAETLQQMLEKYEGLDNVLDTGMTVDQVQDHMDILRQRLIFC